MVQQYKFTKMDLSQVIKISPFAASDDRGTVEKIYSYDTFKDNGLIFKPEEELIIHSKKGVIRGLHFQRKRGQAKLINVLKGKVFVAIVDVDAKSDTYGQWIGTDLTDNNEQIYVPSTCALGTMAYEDSIISCKCDYRFEAENAAGILWNDKNVGIEWPLDKLGVSPVISEKDKLLKLLCEESEDEK